MPIHSHEHIISGVKNQLKGADVDDMPEKLVALKFFKSIVPYAFKQNESVSVTTKVIDEVLANLLIGIDSKIKISLLAGITFTNSPDGLPRVG